MNDEPQLSSPMNISEATEFYRDRGRQLQQDIDFWIDLASGSDKPLKNSNYYHALALTDGMVRRISYRFLMFTGEDGADGFIVALADRVRAMLKRIKANQGEARIILLNSDSKTLEALAREFPSTLTVCNVKMPGASSMTHYIVGDYEMLREESPHQPLKDTDDANIIKANVYFANPGKVKTYIEYFNSMWSLFSDLSSGLKRASSATANV